MQSSIQEIAKLQIRLDVMERQNNRLKKVFVILTLLLVPLFLLGAKHGANDAEFGQITATGITIRDASGMVHIPEHSGHRFHVNPDSDSISFRTPIPFESGQ